jgi:hypothetical protein
VFNPPHLQEDIMTRWEFEVFDYPRG